MKKSCKECPWVVKNSHNQTIVSFSKKQNKPHNCHMSNNGGKKLWEIEETTKCYGRLKFEQSL